MSTGFARDYHMHGEIAATSDGKILGSGSTCSPTTARSTAPRSRRSSRPASSTSSPAATTLQAAHCKVKGVYTNKAPGGVAYACSFRITEAVYLVERMVDVLADELGMDPAELRMKNLLRPSSSRTRPRPAGSTTPATIRGRCRSPSIKPATRSSSASKRRAAKGGRGARPRRAHGHRRRLLHRRRRRRAAQAHGHPRPRHGRRLRAARAPDRQGPAAAERADPGPGSRDDVRPDRRAGARHPARGHRGGPRRHRQHAVRARHLRVAVDAGLRCGGRRGLAQGARQGADHRRGLLECSPDDLEWELGRWFVKGDPEKGKTIQEIAIARARQPRAARRRRGPPRRIRRSTTRPTSPTPSAPTSAWSTSTPAPGR